MKLLGYTEEVTVCDCCGKSKLACTVVLETDAGEVVHYGRTCAALALMGSKSARNVSIIEGRAKALTKVAPVVAAVRAALPQGLEAAIAAGREIGKMTWVNGADVLVGGYASWGKINVHWNGGCVEVPLVDLAPGH